MERKSGHGFWKNRTQILKIGEDSETGLGGSGNENNEEFSFLKEITENLGLKMGHILL